MALPDILARPYHALELKELYEVGDTLEANADLTALKTAAKAAIDTIFAAFEYSDFSDETTFNAVKATLLTDVKTTGIDGEIPDEVDAAPTYHTMLDTVEADYAALVQSEGLTNPCPECATLGKVAEYDVEGTATGDYVQSALCDGYGYTATQKIVNPNNREFIDAP